VVSGSVAGTLLADIDAMISVGGGFLFEIVAILVGV